MVSVITIAYGDRKRLIAKPSSFTQLLQVARRVFPRLRGIPAENLEVYFAPQSDLPEAELDSTAYSLVEHGTVLRFQLDTTTTPSHGDGASSDQDTNRHPKTLPAATESADQDEIQDHIAVYIITLEGKTLKISGVPKRATVGALKSLCQKRTGCPADKQRHILRGRCLEDGRTLEDSGVIDGSIIHILVRLKGGKPAIYLLSPTAIDKVAVSVELSREWDFTVIYPLVDKTQSTKFSTSKVAWNVSIDDAGVIRDDRGRGYTYLFWEAETKPELPAPRDDDYEKFDAARPYLWTGNAVVLSFSDLIDYLETTLEALTLTTSMRTDFMTYWMPKFLRIRDQGLDIALTFVKQSWFEKAAKLVIEPRPATVARVFMLFGGVDGSTRGDNDSAWRGTRSTLHDALQMDWAAEIGLDLEGLRDETAFRAIEWGGMEVEPSEEI